jgi:hypothetical protein
MLGAYLPVSRTAGEDGETDSAMRSCVPRPSAVSPARCRVLYCALQRQDVAGAQSTADVLRVVGPITQYAVRATARPTTRPLERRNAIEQR